MLLTNGTTHGLVPALNKKAGYDPIKDFVPIVRVGETQLALVASKKVPVRNAQELLAHVRANQGKLNYGTFGHGSAAHLFGEVLKKRNGADIVHIPFKGEAAAMQALLASEIELAIIVSAKPYVEQGQVTLIGLTGPESSCLSGMANPVFAKRGRLCACQRFSGFRGAGRNAASRRR